MGNILSTLNEREHRNSRRHHWCLSLKSTFDIGTPRQGPPFYPLPSPGSTQVLFSRHNQVSHYVDCAENVYNSEEANTNFFPERPELVRDLKSALFPRVLHDCWQILSVKLKKSPCPRD